MASILDFLPLVLKALPAAKTQLKGKDLSQQQALASQMNNLANAQIDNNNPLYQNLYNQNRESGNQDLAGTIAEIQRQNRKALTLGRGPLLDQERGGESIFRNLIQGQQNVGNTARTQTLQQLQGGQQALAGNYSTYNDLSGQQYDNKLKKLGGYGNISDALTNLFSLRPQGQSTGMYPTVNNAGITGINWNQAPTNLADSIRW